MLAPENKYFKWTERTNEFKSTILINLCKTKKEKITVWKQNILLGKVIKDIWIHSSKSIQF